MLFGAALSASAAAACRTPPPPPPVDWEAQTPVRPLDPSLARDPDLAAQGIVLTPEKVRLGRWLFFDTRLSVDATVSCATCHHPEDAFSERTPHSVGVGGRQGARKSMTFINGFRQHRVDRVYFWDGRATSLFEQAKGPINNPDEMGFTSEGAAARIRGVEGYRRLFRDVYGDAPITIDAIADALVAYEATRVSTRSAADRDAAGERGAMGGAAKRGRELFEGKAGCSTCHFGPEFADAQFHDVGVGWTPEHGYSDPGRGEVTGRRADRGKFRTPTLRDVAKHPPYMHDGSIPTLRAVVEHYDRGGAPSPNLDRSIQPLGLSTSEIDDLVAYLEALDGDGYQDTAPVAFPK